MKSQLSIILFSFLIVLNFSNENFTRNYNHFINNQHFIAEVIAIKDGDTYVVLDSVNNQITIRLAHIDCPEKKQPYGTQAKVFSSDLCYGKQVKVSHHGEYDRNHRLIAEIYLLNGLNVNKELVKNGMAWHFKKYSSDTSYANLEAEARENMKGLWSLSNSIEPSQWRKNSKKSKN